MKKITLLSIIYALIAQLSFSQNTEKEKAEKYIETKGELTFTFKTDSPPQLEKLSKTLSIINYDPKTNTVVAWANENQFRIFESLNISFKVPKNKNEVDETLIYDNKKSKSETTSNKAEKLLSNTLSFPVANYPTYAEYAQQMQDFENNYPSLVDQFSIGSTTKNDGKEILFVKISDNVNTDEVEPKILFTSSMHGDEIAGYPMMLSLINYILTVYNDSGHVDYARIKNLVENTELWINPNANPDGTYYGSTSNTSVAGARRANHNGWDLNRNYPDNVAGPHPDGNPNYELETQYFMSLANNNRFVISANFHGGTELVNYPFDNAYVSDYTHADSDWFEFTGVEYATHAQNDSDALGDYTYMTADNDSDVYPSPGVTHGAEWYRVYGGRQDYMNFYEQCREITVELSDTKILQESQLANYWLYNRDALLDFLTQGTYGFRGLVKDSNTNNSIGDAKITLVGHDNYGSEVYTDIDGDYYRPVKAGTYDILFEADCYQSVTLANQTISDYQTLTLSDVLLTPVAGIAPSNLTSSNVASTNATISWDAITGAHYDYRYRVVGTTSWTTVSSSSTTESLVGLTHSTQYEVQVRSTCNANTSPYSSSIQFTTTTPPPCSGTIINTFPYSESFENNLGNWTQATNDDFNWSFGFNSTPSGNTGPDGPSDGTYYAYTEANNGNDFQQATLNSPCFDLSTKQNASFSFDYHMYGSQTGSLSLEISIDDGSTWTSIHTFSEQQQGSSSANWITHTEDLSAYDGNYVRLRIIGQLGNINGQSRSDIAIDNVNLTAHSTNQTWYADSDSDGFGDHSTAQIAASQPSGYVLDNTDCDDNNPNINPNTVWFLGVDTDGDGFFGSQLTTTQCTNPGGYSTSAPTLDDCDDNQPLAYPGNNEVLYNGIDDDCNPDTPDTIDADGDGEKSDTDCDDNNAAVNSSATEILYNGIDDDCNPETPDTIDADGDGENSDTDCDDNNAAVNSSATEILYNGIDDDCNPATPDTVDADDDGYNSDVDCNDNNASINPGATEILYNGIDDDCNPETPDTIDVDDDGYNSDVDCDDSNPTINPGATDIPNDGIDQDCINGDETSLDFNNLNTNSLSVTPNPFTDRIEINLPTSFNNSIFNIKLFDLNGRLVIDKTLQNPKSHIRLTDLDQLAPTIYLFKITDRQSGSIIYRRLIKD